MLYEPRLVSVTEALLMWNKAAVDLLGIFSFVSLDALYEEVSSFYVRVGELCSSALELSY